MALAARRMAKDSGKGHTLVTVRVVLLDSPTATSPRSSPEVVAPGGDSCSSGAMPAPLSATRTCVKADLGGRAGPG